ncbi:MAG TPA: M56 family metallopeptidase [Acidobacteriaceae bacterium]|nr:M56 family metallopeptidase [Acidobacteriaceae bacterium]
MMPFAHLVVERVLNSLPEGLLIALGAWLLLRVMGRQNSGTRFAVWLVALAGVVALPLLSGLSLAGPGSAHSLPIPIPHAHPEIAVPAWWAAAFFLLWVAIAALALARVLAGVWQVRRIRRSCEEVPAASIDPELQGLLAASKRPVRLLTSEGVRVPAALGFRNPAIVIPAWALRDLTAAELRPILIHELAHLRRHDDWTNLLQKFVRAVLFFHPAVWWIDARLSLEREMACDDVVLAATGNPRAYAGCLIDLLEKGCARRGWTMAQAAVARARDASLRIARILRVGPVTTTRLGRAALGMAASLALVCAGIAVCTPQLVAFVPMDAASAAHLNPPLDLAKPLIENGPGFQPSAVVPVSFHPANQEEAAPVRPVVAHRHRSLPTPLRRAALVRKREPKSSVVMTRFADLETTGPASPALLPTMVVFETTELRPASATAVAAELPTVSGAHADRSVRQLQSREDPALQIQVLQVIDPETGAPMQVLRILLVVPQLPGSPSQAI